jgi:hypothetical protein
MSILGPKHRLPQRTMMSESGALTLMARKPNQAIRDPHDIAADF